MKKKLLVLGMSLFLVGCSNEKTKNQESKKEDKVVKVDKETKEKAEKYADDFTNGTSGQIKMTFNEKNKSFDIEYVKEDQKKLVSDLSEKLTELSAFNSLVFLAQKSQENKELFDLFNDEFSSDLTNPKDSKLPLYSVKKDKIKYPASEKAFDGKLPHPISKDMPNMLKVATFAFKPNANSEYDQKENIIKVNLNLTEQQLNSSGNNKTMKETIKDGALTIFETNAKVYSEKCDVWIVNKDKVLIKTENGKITEDNLSK